MNNILVIYPGFPHYRNGIIEELMNANNDNYIFAGDKKGYNNIKPYDFKDHKDFHNFPSYSIGPFFFNRGLLRFVLTQKANGAIVHSSPYWITIILAAIVLRLKKVKVYNWTHGILSNKSTLKNKFYYYFYKYFFDGLLLYGNFSKENLIKFGYREDKMKVVYNSLNYDWQVGLRNSQTELQRDQIRSKLFSFPERKQLLFIGRLTAQKKLNLLIRAIKMLQNENILVNLLFVGNGEEKEILENLVNQNLLKDHVCFYGACYDEIKNYELISSSDCCIAPGEIGLTAMHSLMYGVPVISHNDANKQMPEFEAIKHGINGALFEYNNVTDLKEKIKFVLARIESKTKPEIMNDCYQIMDDYYNPKYQRNLIEQIFD